jgi:hypothetical protein
MNYLLPVFLPFPMAAVNPQKVANVSDGAKMHRLVRRERVFVRFH